VAQFKAMLIRYRITRRGCWKVPLLAGI